MFDQLMILAGGHIIYYGAANKAVDYFAAIGYPCNQYTNPSDYFSKKNNGYFNG
jgi:ABC-type multidrug transport system ATPase subunit